jgi:hypothetical protein
MCTKADVSPAHLASTVHCVDDEIIEWLKRRERRQKVVDRVAGLARLRLTFTLGDPHIFAMTQWQKTYTREPPKTKAELRDMLAEAVRNTQSEPKRPPKVKKGDRARSG